MLTRKQQPHTELDTININLSLCMSVMQDSGSPKSFFGYTPKISAAQYAVSHPTSSGSPPRSCTLVRRPLDYSCPSSRVSQGSPGAQTDQRIILYYIKELITDTAGNVSISLQLECVVSSIPNACPHISP